MNKEIKLAIDKLQELCWIVEPNQRLEIDDVISLLQNVQKSSFENYDKLNQNRIENLLIQFDQP